MYANGNLDLTIEEIVDSIEESKLDWAMQQVQMTTEKNLRKGLRYETF